MGIKSCVPFFTAVVAVCFSASSALAAGISVDAGLQPPEDRWILRTMGMFMQRDNDPTAMGTKMEKLTLNTVLAYGLRRDLALILKQPAVYQKMRMSGASSEVTGAGDTSLTAKYGLLRRNTARHTYGLSGVLGIEAPTGADAFTSETWDLKPGMYASFRKGAFASDLNLAYAWNGVADDGRGGVNPGDELSLDAALAYQFSFGEAAEFSAAPVLELSIKQIFPDRRSGSDVSNTGETVFYLSPGLKLTKGSFILEGLVQFPAWQEQRGRQTERGLGFILGARFMF